MKRRNFLKIGGIAVAGIPVLNSVIAQSKEIELPSQELPKSGYIFDKDDRTLTIKVVNKSFKPIKDVVLFGSLYDLIGLKQNNNIKITILESTHLTIKEELLLSPIHLLGLEYLTTSYRQLENEIKLMDGEIVYSLFEPLYWRSAQDMVENHIDVPQFELLVTANTYMKFDIQGRETVKFTFGIKG